MKVHQKILYYVIFSLINLLPQQGFAQYFKCTTSTGKIEFSDQPCRSDARRDVINPKANTVDTSGEREQMMKQEINELKQRIEQAERHNSYQQQPNYGRTGSDLQAERIDSRACEAAKRNYEIVAGRSAKDEASISASRSAMYGACGMREPDLVVQQPPRREHYATPNPPAIKPSTITSCDAGGCWDNTGGRYNRGAGNTFFGPRGACQSIGGRMLCP